MKNDLGRPIRVLVVDDSAVVRQLLTHIIGSDDQLQVIGTAEHGEHAVEQALRHKPDVITMDIHMHPLDGLLATTKIMQLCPTPIVVVSGSNTPDESSLAFKAVEAGALAVLSRPPGPGHPKYVAGAQELIQTIKLMSEVKVIRRWAPKDRIPSSNPAWFPHKSQADIQLVAVGASTGGPIALREIFAGLPRPFPLPLLVVQHMATGFIEGFAEWLTRATSFPIRVAQRGDLPLPGQAYVAPDGVHMGLDSSGRIALTSGEPENGICPSVSFLFRSVAKTLGDRAAGVLLTGMGRDGADGLKLMSEAGAVTMAQDEASSVVFGMPAEAVRLNAAKHLLPPEQIAVLLGKLASFPKVN